MHICPNREQKGALGVFIRIVTFFDFFGNRLSLSFPLDYTYRVYNTDTYMYTHGPSQIQVHACIGLKSRPAPLAVLHSYLYCKRIIRWA